MTVFKTSHSIQTASLVFAATLLAACSQASEAQTEDVDRGSLEEDLSLGTLPRGLDCLVQGSTPVDAFRELMIVDPKVVRDPVRSSNAANGHFSFRWLVEQMAPTGVDPGDFVEQWLREFSTVSQLNGDPVALRRSALEVTAFPRMDSGPRKGKLDLTRAPFELIAIVNRVDLRHPSKPGGEGRFVFAAKVGTARLPFSVIFEYNQPTSSLVTAKTWAQRWHALGNLPVGSSAYNGVLQLITDGFAARGASPKSPNGNSLSQIRTNEVILDELNPNPDKMIWELREFTLLPESQVAATVRSDGTGRSLPAPANGFLRQTTVKQTPRDSLSGSRDLSQWLLANQEAVLNRTALVPVALLGGKTTAPKPFVPWSASGVPEKVRRTFAHEFTCNGCHATETNAVAGDPDFSVRLGFYQVDPFTVAVGDGRNILSGYLLNTELPGRQQDMSNLLCKRTVGASSKEPLSEAQEAARDLVSRILRVH